MTKLLTVLGCLGAMCFVCACSDEKLTEVILAIETDLCVPDEIDAVHVEIVQSDGVVTGQSSVDMTTSLPLTLTLVSKANGGEYTARVFAQLVDQRIVAREVRFQFVPRERRILPLRLVAACREMECTGETTCGDDGTCRPIALRADELLPWDEAHLASRVPDACNGPPRDGGPDAGDGGPDAGDGGPDAGPDGGGPLATCDKTHPCEDGFCVFGVCAQEPWLQHAIGLNHMCSIFDDGSGHVWCRGSNEYLQLGRTEPAWSDVYLRVEGVEDATQVAAGTRHSCALVDDGRVMCWGDGARGQLGRGTLPVDEWTSAVPEEVVLDAGGATLRNVISLSAGDLHTCGVRSDHMGYCWGEAGDLQLGDGANRTADAFGALHAWFGGELLRVMAGRAHTCGLKYDATSTKETGYKATCWGNNEYHQLAHESPEVTNVGTVLYRGDGVDDIRQMSVASDHGCMLRATGQVFCWGTNEWGESGRNRATNPADLEPVEDFEEIDPVEEIVTGTDHTCALVDTDVYCFGSNQDGRLMVHTGIQWLEQPENIQLEEPALGLWAGYYSTCVWLEESGPKCAPQLGSVDEE